MPSPETAFTCYLVFPDETNPAIQPGTVRRDWMDLNQAQAYRCLPLAMANQHGWQLLSPTGFSVTWNGGLNPADVEITADSPSPWLSGHFGAGTFTFTLLMIFRTPPGLNLWVSGPPNWFKDGVQPLSALIETDWIPHTFTMNWKLTRPGLTVRFEKDEPFCFFFPVPRGLAESMVPVTAPVSADPALESQHLTARLRRSAYRVQVEMKGDADDALKHQGWYGRGVLPDGSTTVPEHQRSLKLRPFPDKPGGGS